MGFPVTDLSDFELSAPLREHLLSIVAAATARPMGIEAVTGVACRCRPGRKRCTGFVRVLASDIPAQVIYRCERCSGRGRLVGWAGSPWDLRRPRRESLSGAETEKVLTRAAFALLCGLPPHPLSARAEPLSDGRVALRGPVEHFEELCASSAFVSRRNKSAATRRRWAKLSMELEEALPSPQPTVEPVAAPSRAELSAILCRPDASVEEIVLALARAMHEDGGPIPCMARLDGAIVRVCSVGADLERRCIVAICEVPNGLRAVRFEQLELPDGFGEGFPYREVLALVAPRVEDAGTRQRRGPPR
jgi:hypothetical protein